MVVLCVLRVEDFADLKFYDILDENRPAGGAFVAA